MTKIDKKQSPALKKIKKILLLYLLVSVLVFSLYLYFSEIFADWELKTFDYRMRARGPIKTSPHIILIDIDDISINRIGKWPWDRSVHAKMIQILTLNKARTIAYDILFRRPLEKEIDDPLIKATQQSKRVIYPVGFNFTASDFSGTKSDEEAETMELLKSFGICKLAGKEEDNNILSAKRVITPIEQLILASKGLGHISSNRDSDGLIRRVPLIVELEKVIFPSFAFNVVLDYLNISKKDIIIKPGKHIILKGVLSPGDQRSRDIVIPIDDKGMMLINYAGKWIDTFTHYSFNNILETYYSHKLPLFEDDILVISNVASGYDIKPIPLENSYPGGGIHANIINTILTENFLKEANFPVSVGIIFFLSFLGVLSALFSKWYIKLISLFLLLSGYIILNIYLFNHHGLILQILFPCLAITLSVVLATFDQIQSERKTVVYLTNEKQKLTGDKERLDKQLGLIYKMLKEKEKKISIISAQLESHKYQNPELQLKEKLRNERDEKECLEGEKIAITNKLLSIKFKELQIEARKFNIITKNKKFLEAFDLAGKVALTEHTVLLLGESGTGKGLFAQAIYKMSTRKKKRFLTVDVSTIPLSLADSEFFGYVRNSFTGAEKDKKGLFQEADNGTIFLDEIGNLNAEMQAKLLKVLQDGEIRPVGSLKSEYVDVRVIAATDKNLGIEVKEGRFSKALFARLKRYPIILPPLRERVEDIPYLVEEFIKRYKGEKNISGICQEAIEALYRYDWPENVRQLENVIIRAIINTHNKELGLNDIQYAMEQELYKGYELVKTGSKEDDTKNETTEIKKRGKDHDKLIELLREYKFNIKRASEVLDINRNTLSDHLRGECFKSLAACNVNIKKAALEIAGDPGISYKIESKIKKYYGNLISHIKDCSNRMIAKEKCRRKFKNIPKRYFGSIEQLVDYYFTKKS